MVAMGRSLIDWNARNGYCSGCGGKTIGVWAGAKRQCPEKDRVTGDRLPCISRKGLHNFQYPRTDAVIIMGILSRDGKKMLLGRQKVWPRGMFSCLAGFIEPGESLEEAVRREVWEESGVKVGRVQYASSQPWPFPSNLMIGCIGIAEEGGETIDLGNDPELEVAKWYTREELSKAGDMNVSGHGDKEAALSVPPDMAIARKLIDCFIRDDWGLDKLQ
jgi:NAD+ diphosphatase